MTNHSLAEMRNQHLKNIKAIVQTCMTDITTVEPPGDLSNISMVVGAGFHGLNVSLFPLQAEQYSGKRLITKDVPLIFFSLTVILLQDCTRLYLFLLLLVIL